MPLTAKEMNDFHSELNKKGATWRKENELALLPEATQEKLQAGKGKCNSLVADLIRALHGFSIWEGNKLVKITPNTTVKRLEKYTVYTSCASLDGPARYLVMAGEWEVEYPLLDKQPLRLTGLKKARVDKHDRFRRGAHWLTLRSATAIYFLLQPDEPYEAMWGECVDEWSATREANGADLRYSDVDCNEPRRGFWRGRTSWVAYRAWCRGRGGLSVDDGNESAHSDDTEDDLEEPGWDEDGGDRGDAEYREAETEISSSEEEVVGGVGGNAGRERQVGTRWRGSATGRGRRTEGAYQGDLEGAGRKRRAGTPDDTMPVPSSSKRAALSIRESAAQSPPSATGTAVGSAFPAGDRPPSQVTADTSPKRPAIVDPPPLHTRLSSLRVLEKRAEDPLTTRSPSPRLRLEPLTPLAPPLGLPPTFLPITMNHGEDAEHGAKLRAVAQLIHELDLAGALTATPFSSQSSAPPSTSASQDSTQRERFPLLPELLAHPGSAFADSPIDSSAPDDILGQARWPSGLQHHLAAFAHGEAGGTEPNAAFPNSPPAPGWETEYATNGDVYWDQFMQSAEVIEATTHTS
ncbi:hypothetical protein FRC10_011773 [Ceratobasidium sp. 414]|nr:hypothetical protein FRC10_011773 [Ceratobasidium sp. 414]